MTRPLATISVDVDPIDLHLLGYGHRDLPPDPLVYARALPRLLELFAGAGVRATFFVVGRDAEAQSPALRKLVVAGHEVGSHSASHPMALSRLPDEALREEIAGSREALAKAAGAEVVGFRAPNFDLNPRVLRALRDGGYRYDASSYPTPWLMPARLVLAFKSGDPLSVLRLQASPPDMKRRPHVLKGGLTEFPLAVTGAFRFPLYHTARYWLSRGVFVRHLDHFARAGMPLSYALHAVDALGLTEDSVDARLGKHPGMRKPLEEKLALLRDTLADIAERFTCVPFRERLPDSIA